MSLSLIVLLAATAAGLSAVMSFAWLLQRRTGQSGWIDATWSFAIGAAGVALALAPLGGDAPGARQYMVAAFALAGALRLGAHIVSRSLNAGEDPRYHALAVEWGADFPRRLFWFLQIQAACAFLLSLAVFLAARNPSPFPAATDLLGALLLAAAISGEAWSDATLARFRKTSGPGRSVCDEGPWGWSRHPNYFFQWLSWVGFAVVAMNFSGEWPQGFLALLAPAFMYWLLAHVSGVPPLEKHMLESRGDAFRAYQASVNVFFPGPRKRA
jgi:steroid 5-alpha reductase family enzyme